MPRLASIEWAETYGPFASAFNVPWKMIVSPIASGAATFGSVDTPSTACAPGASMTHVVQYVPVGAGVKAGSSVSGSNDLQFGAIGRLYIGHFGSIPGVIVAPVSGLMIGLIGLTDGMQIG